MMANVEQRDVKGGDIYTHSPYYPWIALNSIDGIGCHTFKLLIDHFGSPENVFKASIKELLNVEGVGKETAKRIKEFRSSPLIHKELSLLQQHRVRLITLKDDDYPVNLREIYDPPPYLYIRGGLSRERDRLAIAIVGSRASTPYGLGVARRMAMELAYHGITIVSGLARGIDSEAHRGTLKAGGRTIAVLGSGIDIIYPGENKKLYEEISRKGAVISEFPISTPPLSNNFPRRNRIISGLSTGVLVIEASLRSGSLITARLALEQGREVFAVPGSITSSRSQGTNMLIKEGAKLVERPEDILEEILPHGVKSKEDKRLNIPLTESEKKIYEVLNIPKHIDIITGESGLNPGEVSAILMNLEIKGLVSQHPGKVFARKGF